MILKFTVANYLSFKDKVVLSMEPEPIRECSEDNIATLSDKVEALKSAVLYGANSSGKSNLLKALNFVHRFIINSFKDKQVGEKIEVESFKLSDETESNPSFFEIEFYFDEIKYRYNFSVDENEVHEENLFYTRKNKELPYFDRIKNIINFHGGFMAEAAGLETKVRSNALMLSMVAQFNGAISTKIVQWVQNMKFLNDTVKDFEFTAGLMQDDSIYNTPITKLLSAADLGFEKIKSEKIVINDDMLKGMPKEVKEFILSKKPDHMLVRTIHKKFNKDKKEIGEVHLNLDRHESLGTQKYFSMAGHIVHALANNTILIVDELDSRLHPLLSALIVKLFNSKINNKNYSQLIFATHNTTLLNKKIFRRDQVWLTKKDETASTKINTLLHENIKNRNDVSYEKNYLQGIYDAVPLVDINLELFLN